MSSATMQAIQAQDYGGPEVLVLEPAPRLDPNADQVLIRLKAAGVNPADWKYRAGLYKQFMALNFPWTPGLEGSGIIESVGANVATLKKGDEVYGIVTGGGDLPERSFQVIRPDGIFVTVAAYLAEDAGKAQNIRAVSGRRASTDHLKEVSELVKAKQLKPAVGEVFPLANARQMNRFYD